MKLERHGFVYGLMVLERGGHKLHSYQWLYDSLQPTRPLKYQEKLKEWPFETRN